MRPLTSAACAVLATTAFAQRTWIVDTNGGRGTDYRSLPAAARAARPGDTVLVRPGRYDTPRTISKAIRLIGEPGAEIFLGSLGDPILVRDIPAGQTFVMRGFRITAGYAMAGFLYIERCAGAVSIEEVSAFSILVRTHGLVVRDSRAVAIRQCDFVRGLSVTGSTAAVTESVFKPFDAGAAIEVDRSDVVFAGTKANGQDGNFLFTPFPALRASASRVRIVNGPGSLFQAGQTTRHLPAIVGDAKSSLHLDPLVTVTSRGNAPPHEGFGNTATRRMPALSANGGVLGRTLNVHLYSARGDLFATFLSLPMQPLALPFGSLWLDFRTLLQIQAGVQGEREVTSLHLPVVSAPALRGLPLAWQAQSGPLRRLEYTNPVVTTLR